MIATANWDKWENDNSVVVDIEQHGHKIGHLYYVRARFFGFELGMDPDVVQLCKSRIDERGLNNLRHKVPTIL